VDIAKRTSELISVLAEIFLEREKYSAVRSTTTISMKSAMTISLPLSVMFCRKELK
jgi:RNase P subunit RPR2